MPRLQPLCVPWQISSSTPNMEIHSKSVGGVNHGRIVFLGCFGIATELCARHGRFGQVAVTLDWTVGIRMYPDFSEQDTGRLTGYDWSAIPKFRDANGGFSNYVELFHAQWNFTNICPNPSVYVLEESEWTRQMGYGKDGPPQLQFNHYIFLGDDYNVEVLARSLEWEILETDSESTGSDGAP